MSHDDEVPDMRVVVDIYIIHNAITRAECLTLEHMAVAMPINENQVVLHRCKVLRLEGRPGLPPNRPLHIACTLSRPS